MRSNTQESEYPRDVRVSADGWWEWRSPRVGAKWPGERGPSTKVNSLDALHEVEARLTDEQWIDYGNDLVHQTPVDQFARGLVHADATTRIRALAPIALEDLAARYTDAVNPWAEEIKRRASAIGSKS